MVATENKDNLSDPDSNQSHFLLKKDGGNAMSESKQNDSMIVENNHVNVNVYSDCDSNEYLKIYGLDSDTGICEVIHQHHELETVKECSSEEEEEARNDE